MNDARDLQNSLNEPKKPRTAYVLSDHSSDSDNDNSVPVPTELDLTLLSSSDDSSTSSDGVTKSLKPQSNVEEDTNLDMSISCENKHDDDASSSSEDSDFVTAVYKCNMKCQYPLFYEKIMSEELNTKAHKAHMKKQIWITESLKQEIIDLSPKHIDTVHSSNLDEIQYKLSSFKTAAAKMFPKHREFVNNLQIIEVFEKVSAA